MINDDIRKAAMDDLKQLIDIVNEAQAQAEAEKASEMADSCKQLFDLKKDFTDAGFTEAQTMQIIVGMIQAAVGGAFGKEKGK